jgi:DNA primase small subunit
MLKRSFEILEPMFISNIIPSSGHGLLATDENWVRLLNQLPDTAEMVSTNLTEQWKRSNSTPIEKWNELKEHVEVFIRRSSDRTGKKASKKLTSKEKNRLETWVYEIVFRYTYPRLDVNVSKARNHLLKAPFCVHPKSGRVCVPVQAKYIDDFDPFSVPTVSQVIHELDDYEKRNSNNEKNVNDEIEEDTPMETVSIKRGKKSSTTMSNWEKTSLKQYYDPFRDEFLHRILKEKRRHVRNEKDQQAALMGDF